VEQCLQFVREADVALDAFNQMVLKARGQALVIWSHPFSPKASFISCLCPSPNSSLLHNLVSKAPYRLVFWLVQAMLRYATDLSRTCKIRFFFICDCFLSVIRSLGSGIFTVPPSTKFHRLSLINMGTCPFGVPQQAGVDFYLHEEWIFVSFCLPSIGSYMEEKIHVLLFLAY
jgi:hypothetical protein